jgi:hypothetical protein
MTSPKTNLRETEFSDEYDYVLVLPWSEDDSEKKKPYTIEIVRKLDQANIEYFCYLSVQKDELMVLFRVPHKVLALYADTIDFKLQLDPVETKRICEAGNPQFNIKPFTINDGPQYTPYPPYDYIYGRYESSIDQSIYMKCDGENIFPINARLKLTYYILQNSVSSGGCGLNIGKLLKKERILAIYPVHNEMIKKQLTSSWLRYDVMPWNQPLDDIKDYFGEKIGLYFCFVGHYTTWLIGPAIVGLTFQLVVWGTGNFSHPVLPFFCVLIGMWSVCMLEGWKREENFIKLRWGTHDFEEDEPERPQFRGEPIISFIDGKEMKYFSPHQQKNLVSQSILVVVVMILLVIGFVSSIYIMRFYLYGPIGSNASIVASIVNAIQITILNLVYESIAEALTKRENHRTDTEYEDSMIAKTFVFQFVNSYASFYFLAFIAPYMDRPPILSDDGPEADYIGECGFDTCMKPLAINLGIIFGVSLTVNNILELGLPVLKNYYKLWKETKGSSGELTLPEKQYILLPYDVMTSNMKDYAEIAVQYGYMTIFIVALPISCLLSVINNYIEVKVDGWKLLNVHQRPIPKGAEDIGNWQSVFTLISIIAIVTNAGLICFTMDVLRGFSLVSRIWIFFTFQWLLIALQQLIAFIIPDEPYLVQVQLARQKHIVAKVIDHVPDEEEEEVNTDTEDPVEKQYESFDVVIQSYPQKDDAVQTTSVRLDVA